MSSAMYERMRANPKFQELVTRRRRHSWTLAFVSFCPCSTVSVMVVAFPASLGQPVSEGSKLTVGVAVELSCSFSSGVDGGLASGAPTNEFDAMTQELARHHHVLHLRHA